MTDITLTERELKERPLLPHVVIMGSRRGGKTRLARHLAAHHHSTMTLVFVGNLCAAEEWEKNISHLFVHHRPYEDTLNRIKRRQLLLQQLPDKQPDELCLVMDDVEPQEVLKIMQTSQRSITVLSYPRGDEDQDAFRTLMDQLEQRDDVDWFIGSRNRFRPHPSDNILDAIQDHRAFLTGHNEFIKVPEEQLMESLVVHQEQRKLQEYLERLLPHSWNTRHSKNKRVWEQKGH